MSTNIPIGIANQQQQQDVKLQLQQIEQQQQQLQVQIQQLLPQQLQQLLPQQAQPIQPIQPSGSSAPTSSNVPNSNISTTDEIFNGLNFLKFSKLIKEPSNTVMMILFQCFYNWSDASPEKLEDHLDEVPLYQTKKLNKIFNKDEIAKIKDMKRDNTNMTKFDIPFFYKLIQFATNSNKLAAPNDNIWSKGFPGCPPPLEHLMFLVKQDRNTFCHVDTKVINILNLSNKQIEDYCDTFLQRLQSIIKQVGTRTGLDPAVTDERCNYLETKIRSIKDLRHISSLNKTEVIKSLQQRDLLLLLKKLERAFNNELKSYCPPKFLRKSDESEIETRDLLLFDDQLTIISGEAGHGKTTLTKYIIYQKSKLESGNSTAIENLSAYTFVFRVVCRDIRSKDVAQFIEGQLPNAKKLFPTTSSLREHLNDVSILWVIDGRDEATADFHGFFQSLLTNIPQKHKIIITTRPNCVEDLENEIGSIKPSTMLIKCFVDEQIKVVAEKYLEDVTKYNNFMSFYQNSLNDTKELLKKPINLSLCLQLWKQDSKLLKGKLTSYKLFEIIFEELYNRLVDRLEGRTNIPTKETLEMCVKKWFVILSKIAVKKHFCLSYDMSISKLNEVELNESALEWKLMEDDCLSSIFDCEGTSIGTNYCFRHNIQIEVLASLYLKRCDNDMLKEVAEEEYMNYYLNKQNPIDPFDFLFECCDSLQYSRIFSVFLKFHPTLQYAGYLLNVQSKNIDYFNTLIVEIGVWDQPLTVKLYNQDDLEALKKVIESVSVEIQEIDLIIEIRNDYETINTILNEYKNRGVSFRLSLKIENKLAPVIEMFRNEGNEQMMNKLVLLSSDYEETAVEKISSLKNMKEVLYEINATDLSIYPKSIVADLATKYSLPSSSSKSFKLFPETCHVHFKIQCGFNAEIVIRDLLKGNQMFFSLSVDLDLWPLEEDSDHQNDLIYEFQSSSLRLKELKINLDYLSRDDLAMFQLIKCNIERLEILLDKSKLFTLEKVIKIICESKRTNLKEIYFQIWTPNQLAMIYKTLPSRVIDKTIIKILHGFDKSKIDWMDKSIFLIADKKFRKLEMFTYPNSEVNESLESITKCFQVYDLKILEKFDRNIDNDDQQIKKIVLNFLGKTESDEFLSFIASNEPLKMFIKKARRNLMICLQLWKVDPCLLKNNLHTDDLFEILFENQKKILIEKHEPNIVDKNELTQNANKWIFSDFCRIASELVFHKDFSDFSKSNEIELLESASDYGLIGSECLSIFMKSENTPTAVNYSFGEYHKEAVACLYLKNCEDDQLRRIAKTENEIDLKKFIDFLSECCDNYQFARILSILLNTREDLEFRVDYLLKIKIQDELCFDALIKEIIEPFRLHLKDADDIEAFKNVIQSLSYQIQNIDLVIDSSIDYSMVSNILTEYESRISFRLILKVYKEHNYFTRLHGGTHFQETPMQDILSLQKLLKVHLTIDYSVKYSSSHLANFASFVPLTDSASLFPPIHIDLYIILDRSKRREVMNDILKVNKKVCFLSVDLEIQFAESEEASDLDENLVSEFLISNVQVRYLDIELQDISTDSIWFKLIHCVGMKRLRLRLKYDKYNIIGEPIYGPTPLPTLEIIIEILKVKQMNLNDLEIVIVTSDQLKLLYEKLPSYLIDITTVLIIHYSGSTKVVWTSTNIPKFSGKKFKRLQNFSYGKNAHLFNDVETIESMRDIAMSVDV